MKEAVAKLGAGVLAERFVEGRPASRGKSILTAIAAGAGVGYVVYRVLRSGDEDDAGDGDEGGEHDGAGGAGFHPRGTGDDS